jgi:hypothetical protein
LHTSDSDTAVQSARYGLALASAMLMGCLAGSRQSAATVESRAAPVAGGLHVPGTYAVGGSCGSQWGDQVELTLLPEGLFSLRQTYRDQDCVRQVTLVYLGGWTLAEDGHQLRLDNGPLWLRRLTILNQRTLRFPDRPPSSPPPRGVIRTASRAPLLPFRDPLHLRGAGALPGSVE